MSPYERRLVVLLSLGGFFEFYDLLFSAYVAPGLVRDGILTTTGIAGFVSALFIGLFIGTATCGFLADRFGRRAIFTVSLLWYSAATLAMAMQTHAFGLNLCRVLAGIGLGLEMITIDTYISELVPKEWRGRAMALNQTIQFSAVPVAALLGWLLNWRWVVLFGSAGALVVWQIRRQLPESPRWQSAPRGPRSSWRELSRPPYARRTIMLVIFNIFQTVGYYGFSAWVPTLLIQRGITISTSLQYTFIIAIAAPFGPLLARVIADRTERKWQIVGSALAIAVCGLLFRSNDRTRADRAPRRRNHDCQQHHVGGLPRLSGRTLPHPHSRVRGGPCLFLEPAVSGLLVLRHRLHFAGIRRNGFIHADRRQHGSGDCGNLSDRPAHLEPCTRRNKRSVSIGNELNFPLLSARRINLINKLHASCLSGVRLTLPPQHSRIKIEC